MVDNAPVSVKLEKKLIEDDGVDPQFVNFGTLTLESDKYVAVRQMRNTRQELLVFDLVDGSQSNRKFITAESAIINPSRLVIALRQGNQLQVYDLENKNTLRSYLMNEAVEFWTWISLTQIGIVTTDAVYHWDVSKDDSPVLHFNRDPAIIRYQIIDYKACLGVNWAFIAALSVDKERRILGALQLYSKEKNSCQVVKAHSGVFADIVLNPLSPKSTLLALSNRDANSGRIKIVGISDGARSDEKFAKCSAVIPLDEEKRDDFPLFTKYLSAFSLVFVITKYSSVHAYDLATCHHLFSVSKFCTQPSFASTVLSDNQGVMVTTRSGRIYGVRVDRAALIPYIANVVGDRKAALKLSLRTGLPGMENELYGLFQDHINSGRYEEAAVLAATSPNGILRTRDTLDKLRSSDTKPSQTPPLLIYFKILLDAGTLDYDESIELVVTAVERGKKDIISVWINNDNLTFSEALGDIISQLDPSMGFYVYKKANCHHKVVGYLISASRFGEISSYCDSVGYSPDYFSILEDAVNTGTESVFNISKFILDKDVPSKLGDLERVIDFLLKMKGSEQIQNCISFLLGYIQENKPEYGKLQTNLISKLLDVNVHAADAILSSSVLSQYDRDEVASACESKGLYKRAFINYTSISDMKRCLSMERAFGDPEMLKKICSLPLNSFLECLEIIARSNYNEKDRTIVSALETYKNISPHACVSFLSSFNLTEATFHYLGSLISRDLLDSELTFKYIEIACSLSRFEDAANMCDKSQNINCGQVKDFLKSAGGKCYIPLIHICDRFNLVEELIIYLYQRSEIEIIEYYVKQHNPARTPEVVGHLMKLDCDNKLLDKLISLSDGKFSVDEMIGVCESNDNLPLIHEYLQSQAQKGNRSESLYTALAKIHIEKNAAPEKFLEENSYYNVKVVGDYCRSINPVLALICYKKGNFVDEVISLTNQNAMFRAQVEYLLPLSDQKVWESVISPSNPYRDHIIDQLVKGNIVGNYEQVHASNLVKASMNVARPQELLELLETLVKNPKFKSSRNLRNLLILAAMKIDRTLVKKYLDEVEDFDAVDIANTATSKGYYDEAYRIYSKAGLYNEAIEVAIKHMGDMECAAELAEKVNTKDIWRKFAKGWLDSGNIDACMKTCIKSNDFSLYPEIIKKARSDGNSYDITEFIMHARTSVREQMLDTEYALSLARARSIEELQSLLSSPNLIDCNLAAEKCYDEGLYEAAAILFIKVPSYSRHAQSLLHLNDLSGALESANKAKNADLWLLVASKCVKDGDFSLAKQAGLNLVTKAEKLENLILLYESYGKFSEIISLLEDGIASRSLLNMSIYTNLAILYCKYHREKLLSYIESNLSNINVPKLTKVCIEVKLWKEIIFLYVKIREYDSAIQIIMRESGRFWDHQEFKNIAVNINNYDTREKMIKYYLNEHFDLLTDLLITLGPKLDLRRLIALFENLQCLPVVYSFLETIRDINNPLVNSVYNDMLIEKQDYKSLKSSIDMYSNFNQLELAGKLKTHENFEMRRISAHLYSLNGEKSKSIEISIEDGAYNDAICTVLRASSRELAEPLLASLAQDKKYNWFTLMLCKCHHILDWSLVFELAWMNDLHEYAMPFYAQAIHNLSDRIKTLESTLVDAKDGLPQTRSLLKEDSTNKSSFCLPP